MTTRAPTTMWTKVFPDSTGWKPSHDHPLMEDVTILQPLGGHIDHVRGPVGAPLTVECGVYINGIVYRGEYEADTLLEVLAG